MDVDKLKVLIDCKTSEFFNVNYTEDQFYQNNNDLFDFDVNVFQNGIKLLKQKRQAVGGDIIKKYLLTILHIIYTKTTERVRFLHFTTLLEYSYDTLIQRLIEKDFQKIMLSKDKYKALSREIIPLAKYDVITQKNSKTDQIYLREIYEYLADPSILIEDCYEIIHKKLDPNKVMFVNYKIEHLSGTMGLLGEYAKLKIWIIENKLEHCHNFFIKFKGRELDECREEMMQLSFLKEGTFYNKYIPMLKTLILDDNIFDFAPSFYFQSETFMVLDDANSYDFEIAKFGVDLDYKCLSLTVKQLAKLHSTSILFEEKLKDLTGKFKTLDEYFPELAKEVLVCDTPFTATNMKTLLDITNKFSHLIKNISTEEFSKRLRIKVFDKVLNGFKKSEKYKNVLCHGDTFWRNIMYKQKDPVNCWFVDFQMCRYVPPALELLIFFYMCTDQETRKKFTVQLIDEYYLHLKTNLQIHSIRIEEILPYEQILTSFEDLKPFAAYLANANQLVMFLPEEILRELCDDPVKGQQFWTVDRKEVYQQIWEFLPQKRINENYQLLYEICINDD